MYEAYISEIEEKDILTYLGYRGHEPTESVRSRILSCREELHRAVKPGLVYMRLGVTDGRVDGLPLEGRDIREHLTGCTEAVVFAATLGPMADALIKKKSISDMTDAVIMDACATAAIENVCDNFQKFIEREATLSGFGLTFRYSPGYGDLPIESQKLLCEALNTSRRIGLAVTRSMIMVPQKSVTAIIGIYKKDEAEQGIGISTKSDAIPGEGTAQDGCTVQKKTYGGCKVCNMYESCIYRKEDC